MKSIKSNVNGVLVINVVISVLILVFNLTLSSNIMNGNAKMVSAFLGLTLLFITAYYVFQFLVFDTKNERIRIIIAGSTNFLAAIFAFLSQLHYSFYFIATFTFVSSMIVNQILKVHLYDKEPTIAQKASYITLAIVLSFIAFGVLMAINDEYTTNITIIAMTIIMITSIRNLVAPSLKLEKVRLFITILIETHLFEVLICLLALMIAFSFILPIVDDKIDGFWNAMWYCFAVITTIGFGDYVSTTVLGRIITVILGIYGIIVVAIITSVIVNYYNAVTSKNVKKLEDSEEETIVQEEAGQEQEIEQQEQNVD